MQQRPAQNVPLLCLAFASFGTVWGAQQAVIAELQRDYGFDESRLGLLLLIPPLFGIPSALSGSRLSARFGHRAPLVAASVILATGLLLLAIGRGMATPWIAMAIMGVGAGAFDIAILTAASRVQADGGTPVIGRVQAIFFVGLVAGGGIGVAVVALGLSYRFSFVIAAALVLVAAGAAARFLVLPPMSAAASRHRSIRAVLQVAGVPVLIGLAFGGFFLEGSITSFSAVLLRTEIGSSAVIASTAAFIVTVGLAIGAGGADLLSTRIGAQRTMAVGAAVAAIGVAAAATATVSGTAVAGLGIAAIGFGGIGPAALTLTAAIDQEHGGGVLSTVTALSYLAFLFGPVAIGQLGDLFGLRPAFGVAAAAAALLSVTAVVGLRTRAPA